MLKTKKQKIYVLGVVFSVAALFGMTYALAYIDSYKPAKNWEQYTSEQLSLEHPESWHLDVCQAQGRPVLKLPKTIDGQLDGKNAPLRIVGYRGDAFSCQDGDLVYATAEERCSSFAHDVGPSTELRKDLQNGLQVSTAFPSSEDGSITQSVHVSDECGATLFWFDFLPEKYAQETPSGFGDARKYDPQIKYDVLRQSPQYKDIVKFAESIRIKDN